MAMEDIYLLNLSQPQPAIRRDRYHMSTMKSINRIATLLYLENLPQHPVHLSSTLSSCFVLTGG
jgi:hypothetical protein